MDPKTIPDVDAYIAQYPPDIQARLRAMRQTIKANAPEAAEKISWGMATYVQQGNLVHFAAQKHHIGFYPGASGVEAFAGKFAGFKTTKGGIQLPNSQPLPLNLVAEVVRWRVEENTRLAAEKAQAKREKAARARAEARGGVHKK
ncbi:MAG: hypothetical protein GXY32_03490 [Ruminococcaceae bacterium]|nr:hypothetical protein [Oscillospiraceae bacterium]